MKKLTVLLIYTIVLTQLAACSKNEVINPNLTQELLITSFAVQTPDDWEWEQDQGIDTFIGRIFNEEELIYFDQGYLSFGYLEDVKENDRTISFQRITINGVPAIIEKQRTSEEEIGRDVRLSVYLDEGGESFRQNRLYTYDPKDEDLIIDIFKTHKFLARVD